MAFAQTLLTLENDAVQLTLRAILISRDQQFLNEFNKVYLESLRRAKWHFLDECKKSWSQEKSQVLFLT